MSADDHNAGCTDRYVELVLGYTDTDGGGGNPILVLDSMGESSARSRVRRQKGVTLLHRRMGRKSLLIDFATEVINDPFTQDLLVTCESNRCDVRSLI